MDLQAEATDVLSRLIRFDTVNPPGAERACQEWLKAYLEDAGLECELHTPDEAPDRPNLVARLRGDADGPVLGYLSHVDTVLADAGDWQHDPWSGDVHDGVIWGRGAIDMKSQTAAEAVALAHLARQGWRPPRGEVKLISVVDEETGGRLGAQWLTEQRPEVARVDWLLNEGAGAVMPYGDRRLYGVCCAEKGTFRFRVRARGRAGHASVPALADNALLKLLPALERIGATRAEFDVVEEPRAFLRAIGEDPDDPAGAVDRMRAVEPRLAAMLEPTLGATFAPTLISAGEKINVIPARAEFAVDCRLPPGLGDEVAQRRAHELLGDAEDGLELDWTEAVVGNRSPVASPLMDAIADWVGAADPGRRDRPGRAPGLHRLPLVPRRVPRLRRLRLLPPAPPDALRVVAADALRRRAPRRARPRLRDRVLRRAPQEAADMSETPLSAAPDDPPAGEKLRLGGMALRNGLLVHGPTSWAAAVRTDDGTIKAASGRKPRLRAADPIPGVRGVARLAEAMAVIPLVKRGLPEARLPFQDRGVIAVAAGATLGGSLLKRRVRGAGGEAAAAVVSFMPALFALRGGELAAYHGVEHKAIGAYEDGDEDARDATKEHERCGSHLVAPMLVSNLAGTLLLRRATANPGPVANAGVALASSAVAVEVFAWCERNSGTALAKALKRPGFEIQRLVGTREPDERQLEVGRAALAEILRAEQAAAA